MDSDLLWPVLMAFGLVGAGVKAAANALGRMRCPACTKRAVDFDPRFTHVENIDAERLRCMKCHAEYRRDGLGPLVPREAWEAGARDLPPKAEIVRR